MKTGSIIFLTKRDFSFSYRWLLSYLIAFFSKNKKQKLSEVKVHAAIIYEYKGNLCVRDIDKFGDEHISLYKYIDMYKNRIEIYEYPYNISTKLIEVFNHSCKTTKIVYDYKNLLIFQLIKSIFNIFVGRNTSIMRTCSEDTARQFNILKHIFELPEQITPNELFSKVNGWKKIDIE